jgi:hypothetical protein
MKKDAVEARKELDALLNALKDAGTKRCEIARVLFAKGFTEVQVGKAMVINPKSAHAMKTDFSVKGRTKWEKGARTQVNLATAKLKGTGGAQLYTKLVGLAKAVAA